MSRWSTGSSMTRQSFIERSGSNGQDIWTYGANSPPQPGWRHQQSIIILWRCIGCWVRVIVGSWWWFDPFSFWTLGGWYGWFIIKFPRVTKSSGHFAQDTWGGFATRGRDLSFHWQLPCQRLHFSKDLPKVRNCINLSLILRLLEGIHSRSQY